MRAIALLEAARAAARQLVDDYWQAIEQVAAELEEGEKLSGGEVAMIVNFGRA
jgi:hypothetical protein